MISSRREERRRRRLLRASAAVQRARSLSPALIEPQPERPIERLSPWRAFAQECAPPARARLRVELNGDLIISAPLREPVFFIGSGPECRLRCTDAGLDRRHYVLFWLDGALYGVDLHRAKKDPDAALGGWWTERTVVEVGPLRLRAENISPALAHGERDRPSAAAVQVQWTIGGQTHVEQLHARLTLIGSARDCAIRLRDPRLAPVQAALVRTPRSLALFHLADNGSTQQHGRPIEQALLEPGDGFQIGGTMCRVFTVWSDPADASSWQDFLQQQAERVSELRALLDRLRHAPPDAAAQQGLMDRLRELSAACSSAAEEWRRRELDVER